MGEDLGEGEKEQIEKTVISPSLSFPPIKGGKRGFPLPIMGEG
jgi:hypothetical protein